MFFGGTVTKANKCEKKRKIFCLVSFVSSSRADHEDSGHVYAAFRDEMKERVSIDFRGRRKVSAFKESTMNEMRWFDDASKRKYLWCFFNKQVPGLLVVSKVNRIASIWLRSIEIFRRHILDASHINGPATQCHRTGEVTQTQNPLFIYLWMLFWVSVALVTSPWHIKKYQKTFSIWINTEKGPETKLSWPYPVAIHDVACCLSKDA